MYASTKSAHAAHDNDNLLIQKSGVSDSKRVKIALTAGLIAGSTALAYHQSSSGVSNRPSSVANIGDGLDRQYHTSTVATAKQTFPTPSQFEEDVLEFAERLVKDDTPENREKLVNSVMSAYHNPQNYLTGFEDDKKAPIAMTAFELDAAMKGDGRSDENIEQLKNDLVDAVLSVRDDWLTEGAKDHHLTEIGKQSFMNDVVNPEMDAKSLKQDKNDEKEESWFATDDVTLGKKIKFTDFKTNDVEGVLGKRACDSCFAQFLTNMRTFLNTPGLGQRMKEE